MKNDRYGKAKILTQSEIQLLFSQSFQEDRDRALFGICLFSACRIREACTLRVTNAYDASGRILPRLTIGKANTKGKLATCSIPIISDLWVLLTNILGGYFLSFFIDNLRISQQISRCSF